MTLTNPTEEELKPFTDEELTEKKRELSSLGIALDQLAASSKQLYLERDPVQLRAGLYEMKYSAQAILEHTEKLCPKLPGGGATAQERAFTLFAMHHMLIGALKVSRVPPEDTVEMVGFAHSFFSGGEYEFLYEHFHGSTAALEEWFHEAMVESGRYKRISTGDIQFVR